MPKDYAREETGSQVVMCSCLDDRYPAENMLDGKESTFWITTGCFPQEFVLKLAKPVQVTQIVVMCINGACPAEGKIECNLTCAWEPSVCVHGSMVVNHAWEHVACEHGC